MDNNCCTLKVHCKQYNVYEHCFQQTNSILLKGDLNATMYV